MRSVFLAALICFGGVLFAQDEAEGAAKLVQRIDQIQEPRLDPARMGDSAYLAEYQGLVKQVVRQKGELILQLWRDHPQHPRLGELFEYRWSSVLRLASTQEEKQRGIQDALAEIHKILFDIPKDKDPSEFDPEDWPPAPVKSAGYFWRASLQIAASEGRADGALAAAALFADTVPNEPDRAAGLYVQAAFAGLTEADTVRILRAMRARWPKLPSAAPYLGVLTRLESKGKPFSFEFADLLTGQKVNSEALKGKVVLIEFFSPTLSTSADRLPLLKMLKESLGKEGLAIVGVAMESDESSASLSPGQAPLKGSAFARAWLKDKAVDWPVAWTGTAGRKEWVEKWGILGIPTVFIMDRRGVLRHTETPMNLKGVLEALLREK